MQPVTPLLLYEAAVALHVTYSLIEQGKDKYPATSLVTPADCKLVLDQMETMRAELIKFNCTAAAQSALKPAECINAGKLTYGLLQRFMDEIDGRIRDEIKITYAFSLNPLEAAFFDPAEPLLGPEVAAKFETAAFDIEEAGKCHALGRSTAAIFHALRVLEVGIKALSRCLDIPAIENPTKQNWGIILGEVKKKIDAKWPAQKDRENGDGELFEGLYMLMLAIKTPRNKTMHPARKYTEQEADRLMRVIGDVMVALAARCDEKGEPKA